MPSLVQIVRIVALLAVVGLAGCSTSLSGGPQPVEQRDVAELAAGFRALGPEVDPEEAARAAQIAYAYSQQLAIEYEITDPPLVHNTLVNMGLKPRGLCWHWAEDIQRRLLAEDFQTLEVHRAIANAGNPLRIDHSTAIVSRRGDTMFEGLVLDPWRFGGALFWSPTLTDPSYVWRPQAEVLEERRQRIVARERRAAAR